MPGYKAAKDRLALLFGGNASDIKLRPLLVYHSEKPRALKNIARGSLPIVWKSNPKAWVTQGIFQDWFFHHSIPKGEKYYLEDVPFNILLWLDSAPGHSPLMDSFHAIFKAVHLPLNTVLLTQPVNHYSNIQEILLTTRSSSGSNVNDESGTTLKQFWKDSNIYKAIIGFFHFPWREVTAVTVNGVWENLCLQFVHDFLGFEKADEELIFGNLVTLSEKLKLDLQEGNFIELLAVQRKGLINEDLMELESRKNNGER